MKNSAKHFFFLTAILVSASAFVRQPVLSGGASNELSGAVYIVFAGKYGGDISRQEIAGQTEVQVAGCAKGARIFNFTISITRKGRMSTITTTSNVLTADMRTQLKSLNKGDVFEFRQAKAYLANGKDVVDVQGSKFVVL